MTAMIQMEEMRQLLCRTYPGLRDRVVATADDWIDRDGGFVAHVWVHQLTTLVQERLKEGNFENSEALFCLLERLITEGNNDVQNVLLTGFVEGLQHQQVAAPVIWRSLLGNLAKAQCDAMDKFYGIKS